MTQALRAYVRKENETLDVDAIAIRLPGLHPALTGFRAAIVADLHMRGLTAYHGTILRAVRDAKPGVILLAGDTMDEGTGGIELLADFFVTLSGIAPVVAVLGNNDCHTGRIDTLRAMYARTGVTLLENETRLLNANGQPIRITGLTDPRAIKLGIHRERQMDQPEHVALPDALAPTPPPEGEAQGVSMPSILLMHQPQLARQYAAMRPSLIVAGHAHGGQFRVPVIGGLYAPGQGFFPRLTSGLYYVGGAQMIVSRGLGNHGFPVRLNNRPHLPIAVLLPE